MEEKKRAELCLLVIMLLGVADIQPVNADSETRTVTFSVTDYIQPYDVNVTFRFQYDITYPPQITVAGSANVTFTATRKTMTTVAKYEGFLPQEKSFLTPIGDYKPTTALAVFMGTIWYYIEFKNATLWEYMTVEGNGRASTAFGVPWLRWKTSGEEAGTAAKGSFIITHTGSSEETLKISMTPKYTATMTLRSVGNYGVIIEETTRQIEITGTPSTKELKVVKSTSSLDLSGLIGPVLGLGALAGAVLLLAIKRKRR